MTNKTLNLVGTFEKSIGDDDVLKIKGYANTTVKDRSGDIIEQAAWLKGGMDNYLKNPIVLAYHNHSKPIGTTVDYSVTDKGLEVVAEISSAAGDVYSLIKDGILKTFSVGFSIKDADYNREDDVFYIKDLELLEISVVSVPANQDSTFSIAKALGEDYAEFKKEYIEAEETETIVDESSEASNETILKEKLKMDKLEELTLKMEAMEKAAADKATAEQVAIEAEVKATQEAETKAVEEKKTAQIEVISTGVERLEAEVAKRMEDNEASLKDLIEGLHAELKENKDEMEALRNSKMQFATQAEVNAITSEEKMNSVLLAKILRRDMKDTKYYDNLVIKSGREHGVADVDWETEFNANVYDVATQSLVVAPLFDNISMTTENMRIPVNPGASTGEWIHSGSYRGAGSTGTATNTNLNEITLVAHKLVTKEYIGYEEDEDALIAILPIVRGHMAQRIANSMDTALLRGTGVTAAGVTFDPVRGVASWATAAATKTPKAVTAKIAAGDFAAARRAMGLHGQNPGELVYIVSPTVYYDLIDDATFTSADKVTDAQLVQIKGFVGSIAGSKVIVSDKFEAAATGKAHSVIVNTKYFKTGTLRGLITESDRSIEEQKSIVVSSMRTGFIGLDQVTATTASGVALLKYT
jgi:HK97 family phage prohead protease/HK97 family phage major capsid protein